MCNDKGYTLIELIIVVCLIGILGTGLVYGLSLLAGQQSTDCANNLSVALDRAKDYAMSRSTGSDAYMEIMEDTDGRYKAVYYAPEQPHTVGAATTYVEINRKVLGRSLITLTFGMNSGNFQISDTQRVRIYYDRNSGAMKSAEKVIVSGGSVTVTSDVCKEIKIDGSKDYKITFFQATGRHTLERE